MRWLTAVLVLLLLLLQYRLWFAEGSLAERYRLQAQVEELEQVNRELRERNAALERDVLELQSGNAGIEQRARSELGMIREGEIFYQVVEDDQRPRRPVSPPQPAAGQPAVGQPGESAR
jgi:cell division protein FtsB